jgi:hypothetical protein
VLPNSQRCPTLPAKCAHDALVALLIRSDFLEPETVVGFGYRPATRASVPKASVDKYGNALPAKDKIRSTEDFEVVAERPTP